MLLAINVRLDSQWPFRFIGLTWPGAKSHGTVSLAQGGKVMMRAGISDKIPFVDSIFPSPSFGGESDLLSTIVTECSSFRQNTIIYLSSAEKGPFSSSERLFEVDDLAEDLRIFSPLFRPRPCIRHWHLHNSKAGSDPR